MTMNNLRLEEAKAIVDKISDNDAYVMMQFIYMSWKRIAVGLEKAVKYCRSDILFKVHTHIVKKLGQSCIGRILNDPQSL